MKLLSTLIALIFASTPAAFAHHEPLVSHTVFPAQFVIVALVAALLAIGLASLRSATSHKNEDDKKS